MALAGLIGTKKRVSLITNEDPGVTLIEFDATVEEIHTGDAEVTSHPVETTEGGATPDVTDHHRRLPERLELSIIVTDDPIVVLRSVNARPAVTGKTATARVDDAYEELKRIKDKGQLVKISTTLREYTNMVIETFATTRNKDTGRILPSRLGFREITIAATKRGPTPQPAGTETEKQVRKPVQNQGTQQTTPSPEPNQSFSVKLINLGAGA